jgi:hypothetical protein
MAFENKPGSGAAFKGEKKAATHADYQGSIKLPDGTDCWLNVWVKEGTKGKFLSVSVRPKVKSENKPAEKPVWENKVETFDDEIPWR